MLIYCISLCASHDLRLDRDVIVMVRFDTIHNIDLIETWTTLVIYTSNYTCTSLTFHTLIQRLIWYLYLFSYHINNMSRLSFCCFCLFLPTVIQWFWVFKNHFPIYICFCNSIEQLLWFDLVEFNIFNSTEPRTILVIYINLSLEIYFCSLIYVLN